MGARKLLTDLIVAVTNGTSTGQLTYAKSILSFSDADMAIVSKIYALLIPIATIALVIYWLMGYIEMTTDNREATKDQLIKSVIWLILGIFLMGHVYYFTSQLAGINNLVLTDFYQAIQDAHATPTPSATGMDAAALEGLNFILLFVALVFAILGWIINLVSTAILGITCLSTKVEIIARMCLIPIGVAPLAGLSTKNEAIKYIKKTLAAMFYGGVALLVIDIATTGAAHAVLNATIAEDATDLVKMQTYVYGAFTQIIAPFAAIGAVSSAKAIANEAFGG